MSVEYEYETKTYVKTEEVITAEKRYCDLCEKEITGPYWYMMTGHNDWGNDSCESVETYDICSETCLRKALEKYVNVSKKDRNTQYMEVQHMNWSGVKGDIKYEKVEE